MTFRWLNKKIKKMKWYDLSLVKIAAAAFILFIAKLWAPLLSLNWYWYLIISLIAALIPLYKAYLK